MIFTKKKDKRTAIEKESDAHKNQLHRLEHGSKEYFEYLDIIERLDAIGTGEKPDKKSWKEYILNPVVIAAVIGATTGIVQVGMVKADPLDGTGILSKAFGLIQKGRV